MAQSQQSTYTVPKSNGAVNPQSSSLLPESLTQKLTEDTQNYNTPAWQAPFHWQVQDLGALRKGSWIVKNKSKKADISVLVFPGDVGGNVANISRWAEQIGLPSITNANIDQFSNSFTVGGHPAEYIVLDNNKTEQSIIAAIVPVGNSSWFFKMMGDQSLVKQEEDAFKEFLSTVLF